MDRKNTYISISSLSEKIKAALESYPVATGPALTMQQAVKARYDAIQLLSQLKAALRDKSFENEHDEIYFFREIKPIVLSRYFYWKRISAVLMNEPTRENSILVKHTQKVARRQKHLAVKHKAFLSYYLSGSRDQDHQYFTSRNSTLSSIYRDDTFSSGYDTVLARFLSNESLIQNIILLTRPIATVNTDSTGLTWTATKTDLIELIYSLQYSKTINDGSADIRSIAESFSRLFNIELGDYYRTFQDIRMRKKGQSNFLDKLKEKLIVKLQETER